MFSNTVLILLTIVVAFVLSNAIPLFHNIRTASSTGLQYRIVPYLSYNRATGHLLFRILVQPCNRLLGPPSPTSWRVLVTANWPWKHGHRPFKTLKTDTFLTVSPGGIVLHTADASVASQITSRPTDFPKAVQLYHSLNLYGENVVATDGAAWRYHRKLTSPMFSEANNQLVWKQALRDSHTMVSRWLNPTSTVVTTMANDTMLLTLSVLGRAGLGQTLEWSNEPKQGQHSVRDEMKSSKGHQMTFTAALTTLLSNLVYLIILPDWFLRISPFRTTQRAYLAYAEWGRYLREIISFKRQSIALSDLPKTSSSDLLTQLLKEHEHSAISSKIDRARLSDSEILGNLFVMLIAGHETSANSILFSLILLAMHPQVQRSVQTDLDRIFADRSTDSWDYEKDLPKLMDSQLNSVLNEELRLFAPAPTVLKYTTSPQRLIVDGKEVVVPAKVICRLCISSLNRNPRHWQPSNPEIGNSHADDLDKFEPDRWLNADGSWYQPPKGAFIPFSDGVRACLGRRFAQVEILAVLASILVSHSIELAVDEAADISPNERESGDSHVRTHDESHKEGERRIWQRARDGARKTLKEKLVQRVTLQLMRDSYVPVTIVKRGEERFGSMS